MMQLRSQSLKDERVCNGDRPALEGIRESGWRPRPVNDDYFKVFWPLLTAFDHFDRFHHFHHFHCCSHTAWAFSLPAWLHVHFAEARV